MRRDIVYLSYEDTPDGPKPTLWNEPGPGRTAALWADDGAGRITVDTAEAEA